MEKIQHAATCTLLGILIAMLSNAPTCSGIVAENFTVGLDIAFREGWKEGLSDFGSELDFEGQDKGEVCHGSTNPNSTQYKEEEVLNGMSCWCVLKY